jgi:hypothetical protein
MAVPFRSLFANKLFREVLPAAAALEDVVVLVAMVAVAGTTAMIILVTA